MGTGYLLSAASGRLGLALGVNGPALTIDTASSSALTAAHLASLALRRRECDLALVGACHLLLSPLSTVTLARAGMLSATGRCRPFAEDANGHVRAEGCGILVLKRHQDASADGDLPYALIRGSAVHQQGDRPGLAVASASGQKAVMELALRNAAVDPLEVHYLEAQANGSRLGGVIESESIAEAYGRRSPTVTPLYLGSCKANIGYLETASGVAGLMKTVLALAHGEIPPQAGVEKPDPNVPWERLSLRFAREPLPWPSGARRLAGVNAFGISGTLAHVVLEGMPAKAPANAAAAPGRPALLAVSAHNPDALAATARRLQQQLAPRSNWDHVAVCRTLAEARDHGKIRRAAVVSDRRMLLDALSALADGSTPPPTSESVFVALPALGDEELRSALRTVRAPGFEPLAVRVDARAALLQLPALDRFVSGHEAAPRGMALAWAFGWLDWLAALKLDLAGATLGGEERFPLCDVIAGTVDGDDACARWLAGTPRSGPPARSGWDIASAGETLTLRRSGASLPLAATRLAELNPHRFIELLADRHRAGAELNFSALSTTPKRGLCRLPGPAFTGKSYWVEQNIWA